MKIAIRQPRAAANTGINLKRFTGSTRGRTAELSPGTWISASVSISDDA